MAGLLDPALLDGLDRLDSRRFHGQVWRVTWATRNPLAGNSAGGRWSPAGRFDVLYASLQKDGALAEAYYHLSRAPVMSSSHVRLNQLFVSLDNVLELDVNRLAALGVDDPLASRPNNTLAQSIGQAAFMLDYQGLLVPSARWDCDNLVVFLDHRSIDIDKHLLFKNATDVNWPAWRSARSQYQNDKSHP